MASPPLTSIVTPFYNTRDFLGECIESVLGQTYENWEYILVNNCSTDGSTEIAESYVKRFPDKIRLVYAESLLSQVQNYNFALTCISPRSKYCKMVQADDWIFPDCIRSMVEVADTHPSVGIVAAYQLEGDEVHLDGLPFPTTRVPGRDVCRLYFLRDIYVFGSPTSLLIRSDLIRSRNPFYEERYAPFEDGHVCFDLLKSCDFGFAHQVLTFSRCDNVGITSPLRRFGVGLLTHVLMLVAHGRDYLSGEEYEYCLQRAEREYFLYLAKCAFARRAMSQEFWEFHRSGLASINYAFDWKRLTRWLPRAVVEKSWVAFWKRWDADFRQSGIAGVRSSGYSQESLRDRVGADAGKN
jgi:glycosyltransferase involved in cell wall biosynthesis